MILLEDDEGCTVMCLSLGFESQLKEGREEDQVSRKHPESGASKKSKPVS